LPLVSSLSVCRAVRQPVRAIVLIIRRDQKVRTRSTANAVVINTIPIMISMSITGLDIPDFAVRCNREA